MVKENIDEKHCVRDDWKFIRRKKRQKQKERERKEDKRERKWKTASEAERLFCVLNAISLLEFLIRSRFNSKPISLSPFSSPLSYSPFLLFRLLFLLLL